MPDTGQPAGLSSPTRQSALIAREAAKSRHHIALRRLFTEAPDMLTTLPCWATSPLVVSQLLPGDRQYFDVVVFDEAKQVRPADAIPSILRGERVVVAGDQQQPPPTAFFLGTDEDPTPDDEYDDDPSAPAPLDAVTAGFESILDVLTAILPSRALGWPGAQPGPSRPSPTGGLWPALIGPSRITLRLDPR